MALSAYDSSQTVCNEWDRTLPNGSVIANHLKASHGVILPSGRIVSTLRPASHLVGLSGHKTLKGDPSLIST